ncbi:hypothetical protein ABZ752_33290 [Streptomyces roseifaciens]
MNTTRSTRTALRTAIAGAVLAGTVAVPTAALAADGGGTAGTPGTASGATSGAATTRPDTGQDTTEETAEETARNTGKDAKQDARKDDTGGSRRTVQLKDGKYAVVTKLGEGSYKAAVTGPDGFVFATLTASAPSVTLDGGLKVTLDRKTGLITQTTVKSRNGEAARDTAAGSTGKAGRTAEKTAQETTDHRKSGEATGKTPPTGGVAAGEAPQERPDTDPALIGGALAAAGLLGGAGVLTARRRKDVRR